MIPNEIIDLADFFKYCMNVDPTVRDSHDGLFFHGWCRSRITPYLIDGKIKRPEYFVENAVYSLKDYLQFCLSYDGMTTLELESKIHKLIKFINNHKNDLVDLIEQNNNIFPSLSDTKHCEKLTEHWNDKAYETHEEELNAEAEEDESETTSESS